MPQIVDEATGVTFEIVDENDPNDPLKAVASVPSEVEAADDSAEGEQVAESTAEIAALEAEVEDVDLDELEKDLDAIIAERVSAEVGRVQSVKDKEIAKRDTELKSLAAEVKALREQNELGKLADLTDEEREVYLSRKALDERKAEIEAAAEEIDNILKGQLITTYVTDYGQYGVSAEDLEGIEDPDAMEAFCERAELRFLREQAKNPKPEPVAAVVQATKPVPAGAQAPADVGGESPQLAPKRGPAEGTGLDKAAQTLNALPWESVRLG